MSSERLSEKMQLASGPGFWEITLTSGKTIQLVAHGYSIEGHEHIFSLLIEGRPPYEVHFLRIPSEIVDSVSGG